MLNKFKIKVEQTALKRIQEITFDYPSTWDKFRIGFYSLFYNIIQIKCLVKSKKEKKKN